MFNAEISAGSLLLPESRRIATLMLTQPSVDEWNTALYVENLLQKKPATAKRQSMLIRKRLQTLDTQAWTDIAQGERELAVQLLLVAAIRHSFLLHEFMRRVYRTAYFQLETHLLVRTWDVFLTDCEQCDPTVGQWAASTRAKLREVVFRILAEAKYLGAARDLRITPPMLHPLTQAHLQRMKAMDILQLIDFQR